MTCEACGKRITESEYDLYGGDCDDCHDEKAYDRFCESYYGGDGPLTLKEIQMKAMELK